MSAANMRFAPPHRQKRAHAADVAGGDLETRMQALELVAKNIDGKIVAAGTKDRALDFFGGSEQLDLHRFAGIDAFTETWDTHQTIRLHHGGYHTRAAAQRHCDQFVFYPSQRHPDQFFHAQM